MRGFADRGQPPHIQKRFAVIVVVRIGSELYNCVIRFKVALLTYYVYHIIIYTLYMYVISPLYRHE